MIFKAFIWGDILSDMARNLVLQWHASGAVKRDIL